MRLTIAPMPSASRRAMSRLAPMLCASQPPALGSAQPSAVVAVAVAAAASIAFLATHAGRVCHAPKTEVRPCAVRLEPHMQ